MYVLRLSGATEPKVSLSAINLYHLFFADLVLARVVRSVAGADDGVLRPTLGAPGFTAAVDIAGTGSNAAITGVDVGVNDARGAVDGTTGAAYP